MAFWPLSVSRHTKPGRGIIDVWQVANYTKFLTDPFYLSRALVDARNRRVYVTLLTLLLDFPLAYALAHSRGWKRSALYFGDADAAAHQRRRAHLRTWMILLGNNGFINRTLLQAGLIDHPIRLMYNLSGVVIALTEVLLPFMILALDAALLNIDPFVIEAARNVGGRRGARVLPHYPAAVTTGHCLRFDPGLLAQHQRLCRTEGLIGGAQVKLMPTVIYQQAMALLDLAVWRGYRRFIMLATIALLLIPALALIERRNRLA